MYNVKVTEYLESGTVSVSVFESPVGNVAPNRKSKKVYTPFFELSDPEDPESDFIQLEAEPFLDAADIEFRRQESLRCSVARTRSKITSLFYQQKWSWFVTFTFDSSCVDRYDYDACYNALSDFLAPFTSMGYAYLIVPELHKDGAFHFHGFFTDIPVVYAGIFKHKETWHVKGYPYGFTTAYKFDDSSCGLGYVLKYITKDIVSLLPNRSRYLHNRSLFKPSSVVSHTYFLSPSTCSILINVLSSSKGYFVGAKDTFFKSHHCYFSLDSPLLDEININIAENLLADEEEYYNA